jgi:hypothetical protein
MQKYPKISLSFTNQGVNGKKIGLNCTVWCKWHKCYAKFGVNDTKVGVNYIKKCAKCRNYTK